jgi:hypothetical protein
LVLVTLGRQRCLRVGCRGDEACRLNGSKNESTFGSLCVWLTMLPPQNVRKNSTRWWFEFKERLVSLAFQVNVSTMGLPYK